MKAQNLSPKLERAAEDYLISKGSSREYLTDEQFQIVAKYVKKRSSQPYYLMLLFVFMIVRIVMILAVLIVATHFIESEIPENVKEIVLASSTGENHIQPMVFKNNFVIIAIAGWLCGIFTLQIIRDLIDAFGGVQFRRRKYCEVLECFLPKIKDVRAI